MRSYFFLLVSLFMATTAWATTVDEFVQQGEAAIASRDIASAMKAFDAALEADPRNAKAAYNRGRINLVLHKNAAAVADFTTAILADPKMGIAYSARAEAKLSLKDEKSAFEDLDLGVKASPNNSEVFILRATYRMRIGDAVGAKADLQSARLVANGETAKMLDALLAKMQ